MIYFEKNLSLNAKNARSRHYLGIIATKLNFLDRAEREFKTAIAIDPAYGEAHFNLAVLYATWDPPQWDKAKTEYQQAIKKGVQPDPNLEKLLNADAAPTASAN
jgi:Tfp pilus assembly protein PilF